MNSPKFICIGGGPSPDLMTNVILSHQSRKSASVIRSRTVGKSLSIPTDTLFNLKQKSCKCFKCIQGKFDECSTINIKRRS